MCVSKRERERERERVRVCEYAEEGDIETANVCERVELREKEGRERRYFNLPPHEKTVRALSHSPQRMLY